MEQRWRDLVEEQASSGLSVRAFCESRGIAQPSLYSWKRELARRDRERTAGLVGPALFAPVQIIAEPHEPSSGSCLEIAVSGVVVRVPIAFDEVSLARVLSVLQRMSGNHGMERRPC